MLNFSILLLLPSTLVATPDLVRNALEAAEERWFHYLLASSVVVAIGCVLEIGGTATSLFRWWRLKKGRVVGEENPKSWHIPAEAIGLLFVILGVVGEAIFETLASGAETNLRAHDERILAEALQNAGDAKVSASDASAAASDAKIAAGKASTASDNAVISAGKASTRADAARQEADSFESRIAAANANAASAEQHLSEALREATQAQEELTRIRSPRSLANETELATQVKAFQGTEYTLSVFQDAEAIQLAKALGDTLNTAGWIRKQPQNMIFGLTYIKIFGQDLKDSVTVCTDTGMQVHMHLKVDIQALKGLTPENIPKTMQTALVLRSVLASHVLPLDNRNVGANVLLESPPGEESIEICVGRKP